MAMPCKTQAKISKGIPTVASALISESPGAEVMLQACWETTGPPRAQPCRTPWVLLQGQANQLTSLRL